MRYASGNAQDRKGNAIGGASVTVTRADGAPVTLYADSASAVIRDNPQITDAEGFYDFWAAAGEYLVTITHTGLVTDVLTVDLPATSLSPSSAENFGFSPSNSAAANAAAWATAEAALAGTNASLIFSEPGTYNASGNVDIVGWHLILNSGVTLNFSDQTNNRIFMGDDSSIHGEAGSIIQSSAHRRYTASLTGNGVTMVATLDADHDYIVGDTISVDLVTIAGFTCGIKTITSVTANTVSFASAVVGSQSTPYELLDGLGYSYSPVVYRPRTQASNDNRVLIFGSTNVEVEGVTVQWGGGIFVDSSSNVRILNNRVRQTFADQIHITRRCDDITIAGNLCEEGGDDMIACIGYKKDGGPVTDIKIIGNNMRNNTINGRGIALSGVQGFTVVDNEAVNIRHCGLLVTGGTVQSTYGNRDGTIRGLTLHTSGSRNGGIPTGWTNSSIQVGSLQFTGGAVEEDMNDDVVMEDIKVFNSRYRAVTGSATNKSIRARRWTVLEAEIGAFDTLSFKDSNFEDFLIGYAPVTFAPSTDISGLNLIDGVEVRNPNRGTRNFLLSAVVTAAAGGTLTLVFKADHAFVNTNVVVVSGVTSSYATDVTEDAEVRKDYAINGTWTINGVPPDARTVIITATGLSATAHARILSPNLPCPNAYVALQSGTSGGNDGMIFNGIVAGRTQVRNVNLTQKDYAIDRYLEISAGSQPFVMLEAASCGDAFGEDLSVGSSQGVNLPRLGGSGTATDSNQTISVAGILGGQWLRSGFSVDRTDTFETAANVIASGRMPVSTASDLIIENRSGFALLFTAGAGNTLTTLPTLQPMSRVKVVVTRTGAAAMTYTGGVPTSLAPFPAAARPVLFSTDAIHTITTAELFNQKYVRSGLSTGRTDTTDTAAAIIGAGGSGTFLPTGYTFLWTVSNTSTQTLTIAGGSSVTISGTATVATLTEVDWEVKIASTTTVTITRLHSRIIGA